MLIIRIVESMILFELGKRLGRELGEMAKDLRIWAISRERSGVVGIKIRREFDRNVWSLNSSFR